MKNPFIELHAEFKNAGAAVVLSSGQACVLFGIAAFSKDGDWIIREEAETCTAVLAVLARHGAQYRLGVPLHPKWLALGLTSHFEYMTETSFRMRTDFCSRPPRIADIEHLWQCACQMDGIDVVDVKSLIQIKQTRRMRDYAVIGALAEVAGRQAAAADLALDYLQEYETLSRAVRQWPAKAAASQRAAVRLLVQGGTRAEVVAALAIEQDKLMQADQRRIERLESLAGNYVRAFTRLRGVWRATRLPLLEQHRQLIGLANEYLGPLP
ncbi:MAG: hypothetical protein K9N49_01680 [Candidatus Marinimicrobia bacterium]|nr:hypothetical protein [Candidatus Neomarinimicrobiota bacterium]